MVNGVLPGGGMSTAPAGDVHWGSGALSRRCRRRAPTSITTIASTSRSHPRRPDAPRQPAHHLSARRGLRRGDRRTRRAAQPLRLARTVRHGIARQTQGAAQAQGRMSGSARKTSSRTIEARRLAHSPRRQKSFNRDATVAESPRQIPACQPGDLRRSTLPCADANEILVFASTANEKAAPRRAAYAALRGAA